MRGCGEEKAETVSPDHLAFQFLFCFTFTLQYDNSSTEQEKKNVFLCLAFKSESRCEHSISVFPHHYLHSCSGESEGVSQESLDFCLEGGVILVYLSGVNFQALSSFWACSSLSLVCSSSAFILRKNKLMAGSTMEDLSWATLGCCTCFRYWICVWKWTNCVRNRINGRIISRMCSTSAIRPTLSN